MDFLVTLLSIVLIVWLLSAVLRLRGRVEQLAEENRQLGNRLHDVELGLERMQPGRVVAPPPLPVVEGGDVGAVKPDPHEMGVEPFVLPQVSQPLPLPSAPNVEPSLEPCLEPIHPERLASSEQPSPPRFPAPVVDWERFVGVKLVAWLGGLALFFAAALALKYSFEHDLIPPALRAAGGFLLGIGLLGGGVRLRQKAYEVTSQTLIASGVVILYAVTFACHALYQFSFFGAVPTFLLMALITATAFLLAVRLDAQVVAVLGMLGGFLTPILLAAGRYEAGALFGYIALLDLGLVAVVSRRRWDHLLMLSAVGTAAWQFSWASVHPAGPQVFTLQIVLLAFPLLYLGAMAWSLKRGWWNTWVTRSVIVVAVTAFMAGWAIVLSPGLAATPGRTFVIPFGADLVLLAVVAMTPRERILESLGGLALFLLLAAWTFGTLTPGLLYWAFGLYLAFAVLHTVFPIVLARMRPGEVPSAGTWTQFVPATALVLVLLPIVRELTVPGVFWGVVLLIDGLAVLLALLAGAVLGLMAVLFFTVGITALWLAQSNVQSSNLSESLVVIGGFALFFFVVGSYALRTWSSRPEALPGAVDPVTEVLGLDPQGVRGWIPALSAGLPFLLLMMVVAQFRPADPSSVFGLAGLLLVLLLGLARRLRSDGLLAVAVGSVWSLEAVWVFHALQPARAVVPLAWILGFHGATTAFPFVWARLYRDRTWPWAVSAISGPLHFLLVYSVVRVAYPHVPMGLLSAAFALPALLGLSLRVRDLPAESPARLDQFAWLGGVALLFITLIVPLQFEKQWITLAWGLEGAALCWLFRRVPHPGLRWVGVALLATAFVRLTLNPAVLDYHPRAAVPLLNWYAYAYSVVAASLFLAARWLAPPRGRIFGTEVPPWLQGAGAFLLFLLVNIEIADYFSTGPTLTFDFSGNLARDMAYTIAWALFSLALLVVGLRRQARPARYAALGLLGITTAKLFLHDLAQLGQLYRIGAFAMFAIIAILASFLYQRFLARGALGARVSTAHDAN